MTCFSRIASALGSLCLPFRRISNSHPQVSIRRIFVDVSTIKQGDARTGIQRVVRALVTSLSARAPADIEVQGTRATRRISYRTTSLEFAPSASARRGSMAASRLSLGAGDIFLALDLSAHIITRHKRQVARWKRHGAKIAVVVYDLLPYSNPEWFTRKARRNFLKWLDFIALKADIVLPISRNVEEEFSKFLRRKHPRRIARIRQAVLPLSGDIDGSVPSLGVPPEAESLLARMRERKTLLMVGTIEPRKGHADALAAHQHLRAHHPETAPRLVIVGKPGWKTEALQQRLRDMTLENQGVVWLPSVSDEFLESLYRECAGVLVASLGEGYCLPIREAIARGKPVLARDLPVFREFESSLLAFFHDDAPEILGAEMQRFLARGAHNVASQQNVGWDESASVLLDALVNQSVGSQVNAGKRPGARQSTTPLKAARSGR